MCTCLFNKIILCIKSDLIYLFIIYILYFSPLKGDYDFHLFSLNNSRAKRIAEVFWENENKKANKKVSP